MWNQGPSHTHGCGAHGQPERMAERPGVLCAPRDPEGETKAAHRGEALAAEALADPRLATSHSQTQSETF